jgi:hypothetical protein
MPSKRIALPCLPVETRVAPEAVPLLAESELSLTVVPELSSNPKDATSSLVGSGVGVGVGGTGVGAGGTGVGAGGTGVGVGVGAGGAGVAVGDGVGIGVGDGVGVAPGDADGGGVGDGDGALTAKLRTRSSEVPWTSVTISRTYLVSAFEKLIVILQPGVVPQTIEPSSFSNDHVHVSGPSPVEAVPSSVTF